MKYEITLTDEQDTGIAYWAEHNSMIPEAFILKIAAEYADRGIKEAGATKLASITAKLTAEPTILADVEAVVDAKIDVLTVAREQKELEVKEAVELKEAEVVKE
jgi:hypothetical protein